MTACRVITFDTLLLHITVQAYIWHELTVKLCSPGPTSNFTVHRVEGTIETGFGHVEGEF